MDLTAQRAIDPPRATVLRTRLEPLCIAHLYAIMRWAPAILTGDRIRLRDLLLAVFICSQPGLEGEVMLSRRATGWLVHLWGWRCRKLDVQEEAAKFVAYITSSFNMPATVVSRNSRTLCSHWLLLIHAQCLGMLGLTYSESMTLPIAWILYAETALRESDGKVELWSEENEAFWTEQKAKWDKARN